MNYLKRLAFMDSIVEDICKKLDIPISPRIDVFELAEKININIHRQFYLGYMKKESYKICKNRNQGEGFDIFLSMPIEEKSQRAIVAELIGFLVIEYNLDKYFAESVSIDLYKYASIEQQKNSYLFAIALLLHRTWFVTELKKFYSNGSYDLREMSRKYQVPISLIYARGKLMRMLK